MEFTKYMEKMKQYLTIYKHLLYSIKNVHAFTIGNNLIIFNA